MTVFRKRFSDRSIRAQWWDYGRAAAYFVTICTKDRSHYFGEIQQGKMDLTPIGAIADVLWQEIKNHATDVELDAFVVMPNHIHGILILKKNSESIAKNDVQTGKSNNVGTGNSNNVGTGHALSLQTQSTPNPGANRFQNIGNNTLSSIIGSYKSAVTRHSRRLGYTFAWQARFHDHIIRNDEAYQRIAQYIRNNPRNWKEDTFFGKAKGR